MTRITAITARGLAIAVLALGPATFAATAHADTTTGASTATSGTTTTQTTTQQTYRGRYQLRLDSSGQPLGN